MSNILLIIINITIFVMFNMQLSGDALNQWLIDWGINYMTFADKPITWISSGFIHANLSHIAMNMLFLFLIGWRAEKTIGSFLYTTVYFLSLIASSFASALYIINVDGLTNVVGASGAIFGVFAFSSVVSKSFKRFVWDSTVFHIMVFVFDMPIAWYAHLGGAIVGIMCGIVALVVFKFKGRHLYEY